MGRVAAVTHFTPGNGPLKEKRTYKHTGSEDGDGPRDDFEHVDSRPIHEGTHSPTAIQTSTGIPQPTWLIHVGGNNLRLADRAEGVDERDGQ